MPQSLAKAPKSPLTADQNGPKDYTRQTLRARAPEKQKETDKVFNYQNRQICVKMWRLEHTRAKWVGQTGTQASQKMGD